MTTLLAGLWDYRKLILYALLAVAAAAGWLYVAGLRGEVARLSGDLELAERTARHNAAAADAIRKDAERKLAVLAEERDALAQRSARVVIVKEKISRAAPTEDGPVAPVVCHALDGLWPGQPAARGACRAHGGAAEPADLRPAAGTAAD